VARSAPSACRPVTGSWSGRGTGHPSARSLTSCGPIPTAHGRSWRPTSGPPTTSPASTPLTGSRSCPSGGRRRRVRCRCAPVRSRSTWRRGARRPTAHGRRGARHQSARNRRVVPGQGLALDPRRLRPHRGREPRKARPRPTPAARGLQRTASPTRHHRRRRADPAPTARPAPRRRAPAGLSHEANPGTRASTSRSTRLAGSCFGACGSDRRPPSPARCRLSLLAAGSPDPCQGDNWRLLVVAPRRNNNSPQPRASRVSQSAGCGVSGRWRAIVQG
jgi:hypothetical protein